MKADSASRGSRSPKAAAAEGPAHAVAAGLPGTAAQRALERTISASPRMLLQKSRAESMRGTEGAPVQLLLITAARLGLAADFDSTQYAASMQMMNQLIESNKLSPLVLIRNQLEALGVKSGLFGAATQDEVLLKRVKSLLEKGPDVAEIKPMSSAEKGVARAAVAGQPAVDEAQRERINIWVVGDRQRGIVWGALGNHLRGRIDDDGYRDLGIQCYLLLDADQRNAFDLAYLGAAAIRAAQIRLSKRAFDSACNQLSQGLGTLPDFNGTTYRQAGILDPSVYNGKIAVGQHIMDKAFWSTSILRGAGGAAGDWTDTGSQEHPVAFYVIQSATGKYIAKYAQTAGEQEVLFNGRVVFQVTRIVNVAGRTFFVYVNEVPPPAAHTPILDPFTGNAYPLDAAGAPV